MTLPNIFRQLRLGNSNYFKLLANYNSSDWVMNANYNLYAYNPRIIYHDNMTKVKLITWMPSQGTEVHGHPEYNECHFKILRGQLNEDKYDRNDFNLYKSKRYNLGDIGFCSGNHVHRIRNIDFKEPAVSLHIYSLNGKDEIDQAYQDYWLDQEMEETEMRREQIIQRVMI